jgi:hypothetical protein
MTAAEKLAEMKLRIQQAEHSEKALKALKALGEMILNGDAHGLRLKANRGNGSQEVVLVEDLGPAFEESLFESIHRAIEFHTEQLEEIVGDSDEATAAGTPTLEGPQADPEHGPIAQ